MPNGPNQVTPERFKDLKTQLSGTQSLDEAKAALRSLADDPGTPPILRIKIASALVELASGRSVQSAMARLRRATGLDRAK